MKKQQKQKLCMHEREKRRIKGVQNIIIEMKM